MTPGFIGLSVLAVLAVVAMRAAARGRSPVRPERQQRKDDVDAHLARIENALEALAVEIERIGEGQRLLTRLFAQSAIPPSGLQPEAK